MDSDYEHLSSYSCDYVAGRIPPEGGLGGTRPRLMAVQCVEFLVIYTGGRYSMHIPLTV
jgi:hypothetical protein